MMTAAIRGYYNMIKLLIERGADVNAKSKDGNTALITATSYGRIENVKLLIDKGADINAKSKNGGTALIWAAKMGRTEIIKLLLEKGADVSAKMNEYMGEEGVFQTLAPKAKDKEEKTALDYAKEKGNEEIVKLLKKAGATE